MPFAMPPRWGKRLMRYPVLGVQYNEHQGVYRCEWWLACLLSDLHVGGLGQLHGCGYRQPLRCNARKLLLICNNRQALSAAYRLGATDTMTVVWEHLSDV